MVFTNFNNSISDVSGLGGLENLTYLDLRSNSIIDVSELGKLTKLESLYLSENKITDYSPLNGIKGNIPSDQRDW